MNSTPETRSSPAAPPIPAARPSPSAVRPRDRGGSPFASLVGTEWRLHRRHGVATAVAVTTTFWCGVLALLPAALARAVVPWMLLLDVAALGLFFVPALVVLDRSSGMAMAHRVSGIDNRLVLVIRIGLMAVTALASSIALLVTARLVASQPVSPAVLGAVVPTAAFLSLLAMVAVGGADSLMVYLSRVPVIGLVVLGPAMLDGLGVVDSALVSLSPATSALRLLSGVGSVVDLLWLTVWSGGLSRLVARDRLQSARPSRRTGSALPVVASAVPRLARQRSGASRIGVGSRWRAMASLASVDRHVVAGDRLLILILAGIPTIVGMLRWLSGPGATWINGRYGFELQPHLPAVVAFVAVIHVPTMSGSVIGLLFLEDRDAGVLPALATSRYSLSTVLSYRLALAAVTGGAAVLLALVAGGVPHPAGPLAAGVTAMAAAMVAPLAAMVLAALARDRAQAMAVMKAMGLPLYLPVAWWFVDSTPGWAFGLLPTAWPARAYWSTSVGEAVLWATGGMVLAAATTGVLVGRFRRRVV